MLRGTEYLTPSSGTATTQHPETMTKKKTPSKPTRAAKKKTGGGCPEATCSACRFWRQEGRDKRIGVCVDAVERARKVVPFAINLQASFVFGHGGKDCPCFEPNNEIADAKRSAHRTVSDTCQND